MTRRLSSSALYVAALFIAGPAWAVPESLLRNSPFIPAGNPVEAKAEQPGRLELRGIVTMDGKPQFTIFDTSNSRAIWLAVGESDGGIRVAAYDQAAEAVTVEVDGQSQRLVMKEAEIVNVAVSLPNMAAPPVPGQPSVGVNPMPPANDREVLERRRVIVEELRRRRALRQSSQPPQPTR